MPQGPGPTAADHILWSQRIQKEGINAKTRPEGFSVRAAVSVPDVPSKFKPGQMDPREASGAGFDPRTIGWDPKGTMTTEFRRCMNQQKACPRERHMFPETCQQEIGWIQAQRGKLQQRSEPAGSRPTRLGIGWLAKDGHGGVMAAAAEKASNDSCVVLPTEVANKKIRKSKDGNVREELGVPPYATYVPCAQWENMAPPSPSRTNSKHKDGLQKYSSLPALQVDSTKRFVSQERALETALARSRQFLNGPQNHWYKPLSNSDVAQFADAYTKAWGSGLYCKSRKG